MPTRFVTAAAEASFVAYVHYLEDLAGVIGGRYGFGARGVLQTMRLHPPVWEVATRTLSARHTAQVFHAVATAWTRLAAVANAVESADRQANAVVPALAFEAVVAVGRALAVVWDLPADEDEDVLALLGEAAADELFPYPWSATCSGCPQLGGARWGGAVLPGETVSVFAPPRADTSDARLATLLRTTRQRVVERAFALERQTDVRPGRTRRNLSREHKELVAEAVAPTTVFDVLDRVRRRVIDDDGEAFVEAPYDDVDALRLAEALALVADASMAVVEGLLVTAIGQDVYRDLLAGHLRRHPEHRGTLAARVAELQPA